MEKQTLTTDNQLHDLIVPTTEEHFAEDYNFGQTFTKFDVEDDNNTPALNEWGNY